MKLEDIEIDMQLVDRYGNEYTVFAIDDSHDDRGLPVRLECTKHVKNIKVDDDFCFSEVGQRLWIYKSVGAARKYDHRQPTKIITVQSLRPKSEEE